MKEQENGAGDLTDEQILEIYDAVYWGEMGAGLRFSRAIERAAIAAHLARQPKAEQPSERELDLYDEIECDLEYLFGRASNEGHAAGQELAKLVKAKMQRARLARQDQSQPQSAREMAIAQAVRRACVECYSPDDLAADWSEKMGDLNLSSIINSVAPAGAQNALPEGCAIDAQGTVYHNIAETYYQAECAEAMHMWLDDQGIPRADADGKVFSLVGRVARLIEVGAQNAEAIRNQALEEAAEKLEQMNDSSGDAAAYDQREQNIYELEREHAISDCVKAIRALQSGTATTKESNNG